MRSRTLVIGTSPALLMRALELAVAGDRVTIVDQAGSPGGAWATPPLAGLESVENAVHLLENRPHFYAALRALGIELEPDKTCMTYWRGRALPMAPTRAAFHTLVAANALRRGDVDRARRVARSAFRSARHSRTAFHYPRGGCHDLHAQLLTKLEAHGIVPDMGVKVNRLNVDPAGVVAETSAGPLKADRVMIASRAHAPLILGGRAFTSPVEDDRIVSLVLRGVGPVPELATYAELVRDPLLKRVRNVTRYCRPTLSREEFVMCVQLRSAGEMALEKRGPSVVLTHLTTLGIVAASARLTDNARCVYSYRTITDAGLRAVRRRGFGRILTVQTTDFAEGFGTAQ